LPSKPGTWVSPCGSFACLVINVGAGFWSAQYDNHKASEVTSIKYLLVYCILLTGASVLYAMATSIFTFGSLRASRAIHRKLISSVLGTTLRWLDSTPTARVIARCTQDMQGGPSHWLYPCELYANSCAQWMVPSPVTCPPCLRSACPCWLSLGPSSSSLRSLPSPVSSPSSSADGPVKCTSRPNCRSSVR